MNLTAFFRVLLAHWFTIVGMTVLALIAAAVWTYMTPRSYTASADLLIDGKARDPISGQTMPTQLLSAYIATQADIIKSRKVASLVIQQQDLMNDPLIVREFHSLSDGPAPTEPWLLAYLINRVYVAPHRSSNVMAIAFKSQDPELAAKLANAFAEAYISTSLALRIEPAKQITHWYNDQLETLRAGLIEKQNALSAYQEDHNIIASTDRLDLETTRLTELSSMLVAIQGQRLESESRSDQLTNSTLGPRPAQLLDNPQVQKISADLAQAQARLNEQGTLVGSNHPQYRQAQREVEAIKGQLKETLKLVGGSMRSTVELTKAREEQLKAELAAQKEVVLQLNRTRNDLTLLRQEVDIAQAAYDAALSRSTQTRLESQIAQTDAAILNAAIVPSQPTEPKPAMNMLLALVVGILLGVTFSLCREWIDRRVRSIEELETRLGLPVLAYIPAEPKSWAKREIAP